MKLLYVFKERAWRISLSSASRLLRISTGDKNTCTSASSPSTSLIAGIGLAVSAIAQPAVPTKGMVVTPFEQVKFSYWSDKAARESDCCGRKGPGQRPFLDVFEVQERSQPQLDLGVFFSQRPNRFDKRPLGGHARARCARGREDRRRST